MAFVKLDTAVLTSTLWLDRDGRDVFLTALLMAEPREYSAPVAVYHVRTLDRTGWDVPPGWYGFVAAAGPGIVSRALVEAEAGLDALERLGAPDPQSRSPEFDGRRLVRVDGGYILLNYMKYRDRDHSAAERMRRFRARKKGLGVTPNSDAEVTADRHAGRNVTDADADADAEQQLPSASPPAARPVTPNSDAQEDRDLEARATADAVSRFPEEYRGDIETALGASRNPYALARELVALLDGMHGSGGQPVSAKLLGSAVRDLLLEGSAITGFRLRVFANGLQNGGRSRRARAPEPAATSAPVERLPEV